METDPHYSVALSKSNEFLFTYCKFKTNFIAKSHILYMGCPLAREGKQKKNPIFISKVSASNTRECPLTGICKYRI